MVFYTAVLPALISAAVIMIARMVGKRTGLLYSRCGALGLALGYFAGYSGILGRPAFPPVEATQLFFFIAAASLIPAAVDAVGKNRSPVNWFVRVSIVASSAWFLLRPFIAYRWSVPESAVRMFILTVLAMIFWNVLDDLGRSSRTRLLALYLVVLGTAESIVIILSHSAAVAQLQGILVAALAAALAVSLVFRDSGTELMLMSALPVVVLIFFFHAAGTFFFADMPLSSGMLLWLSPVAALPVWRRSGGERAAAISFGAAAGIAAAAVIIAARIAG